MKKPAASFADLLPRHSVKPSSGRQQHLHPKLARALRDALSSPVLAQPKLSRGRQPKDSNAWRMFVLVVLARRDPAFKISDDTETFTRAALLGEGIDPADTDSVDKAAERYKQNYWRALRPPRNWRDEDVPNDITALYASAPPRRESDTNRRPRRISVTR